MMIQDHLISRHLQVNRYTSVYIDENDRSATFLIWNLSGQLVGYQVYRPDADKMQHNHPREGRYYTYLSGKREEQLLGVWGLETLNYRDDILFVCEGTFKCTHFHNHRIPAIAAFSNNPKHLKNVFYFLSMKRKLIFVGDNDGGGSSTKSMGYPIVYPPNDVKDVDEMSDNRFKHWIADKVNFKDNQLWKRNDDRLRWNNRTNFYEYRG